MAKVIEGGCFEDERGIVFFNNSFDMTIIKRSYLLKPAFNVVRAWNLHEKEKKWFRIIQGKVLVKCVKLDSFKSPSKSLSTLSFCLEKTQDILFVPEFHANGLQALTNDCIIAIYSNLSLEESQLDITRIEQNYWGKW